MTYYILKSNNKFEQLKQITHARLDGQFSHERHFLIVFTQKLYFVSN